ncbi:GntR family transcriptional regulator [Brevibacterium sp. BRM-1]|uniref:FadR/GntR family transcriptional regulator n=1 Tax=Brevibacterium sp. BRM-1 TaxID=2999062 RepID=UPI00227EA442|nr:FCD domain-containing protein [Brevibacterium sp. BRM-1]WAL40716.1 GntR family transcriptional regulator [Brevibacterium sp. BRM-1]
MDDGLNGLGEIVATQSTPQQIADHILSAIAVGALPEGTALPPERELAAALGVSRSSVRAALDRLQRGGFVDRRRGRGGGTFIALVSPAGLRGVADRLESFRHGQRGALEARALVQNGIARLAAQRRTDEELALVRRLAADYAAQHEAGPARAADARFHAALARAAHNEELAAIAGGLDLRINTGFRHDPFSAELARRAALDHAGIVEAVAAGDAERAGSLCEEHFRTTTMLTAPGGSGAAG